MEVYRAKEGEFIIYVSYRNEGGQITLADLVRTNSLRLETVRSALKEAGIYPGPMYGEAIYHSFDTLELPS